jgi:uncharacterized protein YrrD
MKERNMTMEKTILFQKNANVLAANGQQIGSLERVVLNPETRVVTDIVVRTGTLFNKKARVVPVELVVETTENQIVLRDDAGDLESFPPFEERHLIDENGDVDQKPANAPPVIYGYPGASPMIVPTSGEQFVTQIEQNIPAGTVAMKEGAKVISADGKHVGNVVRVLADSSVDQVTHLLISAGTFNKEKKLIPIKWVMTVGEDDIHLRVNKESIEELADTSITT